MSDIHDIQGLRDLSDGDLALQLENMAERMESHPAFNDPNLAPCIPGPARMREHAVEIKQVSTAAKYDPAQEAARLPARESAIQSVRFSSQYVVMYSAHVKDPSLLDNLGLDRARKTTRNMTVKTPRKFEKFTASHGSESGSVKFHVNSWEGKGSVEVQICFGDPASEDAWQALKTSNYCHFTVSGLEPARRAYFRSRLLNDAGTGPWSQVVELIII